MLEATWARRWKTKEFSDSYYGHGNRQVLDVLDRKAMFRRQTLVTFEKLDVVETKFVVVQLGYEIFRQQEPKVEHRF